MAESELKVLLLEDIDTDAELATRELRRSGLDCQTCRVQTEAQFRQALVSFEPDVVLADFSMPGFDGLSALRIARVLKPGTPFIFVSGTIGEDRAVESLREGATDYVLKTRLSRLPAAVTRAITERTERTARKQAEEALRLTQQAIESSINPIIITGDQKDGAPIVYVNPAFERITGYAHDEVLGRNCRFLQGDDRTQQDLRKVRLALDQGHEARALLRNYRKDGSLFWNELYVTPVRRPDSSAVTHFVGVLHDVTDMKHYQEQLERQANYDALTGLANRNLLRDRLDQAIAAADRYDRPAMVLFVDLDNFKLINDTLGHVIGDALLVEVARRLSDCVRLGDTVARVAGDEFVVVLSDQGDEERGHEAIAGLQRSLSEPCEIQGNEITVTASIGTAMYPHDATDPESLVRLADVAMHRAKEMGRNSYQFYREEMTARIRNRVALEGGLRRAL
ncbi:MAG: diguanylate cyclase, partial [Burkholderiales bacterium]|nr:diguanylate cyclase [Burkholderiales bacterium]